MRDGKEIRIPHHTAPIHLFSIVADAEASGTDRHLQAVLPAGNFHHIISGEIIQQHQIAARNAANGKFTRTSKIDHSIIDLVFPVKIIEKGKGKKALRPSPGSLRLRAYLTFCSM